MPAIETIVKGMPTTVQVMVKVPSLMLGSEQIGRVFWQKAQVDKELIVPMVNLLEDGVDKAKVAKAKIQAELREKEEENEELRKTNADLHKQLDLIESQVNKMREMNDQYFQNQKTIV